MNKTFQIINKKNKTQFVVIRQLPSDRQYSIGDKIPGYGLIVGIRD